MLIDKAQTASFANESAAWPQTCQVESKTEPGLVRLSDFTSTKKATITGCPMGQTAQTPKNSNKKGARAYFNQDDCQRCHYFGQWPVTITKKKAFGGVSVRTGKARQTTHLPAKETIQEPIPIA
jgi:hypothetical protein